MADLNIPIPPSQCHWFRDYIVSMKEGVMVTKGSIYRLTDHALIGKTAFAPVIEQRHEDLQDALDLAKEKGVRQLWITEHPLNIIKREEIAMLKGVGSVGRMGAEKKATYLVPLQDPDWRPNKKVRQNCRNFEKAGGEVKTISTLSEMNRYHEMYLKSREELGLLPWHTGAFNQIWDWIEDSGDYAYVVYATLDGEMIAALSFLVGRGWVSEAHVARKDVPKIYPMESIRVEGMRIARERGHRVYNLGGVSPNPPEGSKEEGIKRNKSKYNGEYVEYNRYYIEVK